MNKLKAFWGALPHQLQASLVIFASGSGMALLDALSESLCFKPACLRHYAAVAVGSGMLALKIFYMKPNKPAENNEVKP